MDPVTAIGLVASIASLVKAGRTISNQIILFWKAPKYVKELRDNLSEFAFFFEASEQSLRNVDSERVKSIIVEAKETLDKLKRIVEEVEVEVEVDGGQSKKNEIRRIKWLRKEKACCDLQKQLARHRSSVKDIMIVTQS
jgi:hypothetical protein